MKPLKTSVSPNQKNEREFSTEILALRFLLGMIKNSESGLDLSPLFFKVGVKYCRCGNGTIWF